MRYDSAWYAVWLVPESDEDAKLVAALYEKIKGQRSGYEFEEPYWGEGGADGDFDDKPPVGALVMPR